MPNTFVWYELMTTDLAAAERFYRDVVGWKSESWGADGNYIEAITGIHNVTRFNSPLDGTMSPAAMAELCSGIANDNLQTLILGEMAPNPNKACKRADVEWTFQRTRTGVVVATRKPVAVSQNAQR